jgi:hypothetical protein
MDIDLTTGTRKHRHRLDRWYWKTWKWTGPLVLENMDMGLATGAKKHVSLPGHWYWKI